MSNKHGLNKQTHTGASKQTPEVTSQTHEKRNKQKRGVQPLYLDAGKPVPLTLTASDSR